MAAVVLVEDKLRLARELGADYAVDARSEDPAATLQRLGGADAAIVLAAAPAAFEEVPVPEPGLGEILVRVEAASLVAPARGSAGAGRSARRQRDAAADL